MTITCAEPKHAIIQRNTNISSNYSVTFSRLQTDAWNIGASRIERVLLSLSPYVGHLTQLLIYNGHAIMIAFFIIIIFVNCDLNAHSIPLNLT